jgi:hypothetical protein
MKTRDQQEIHQLAQSLKQEVHVVALGSARAGKPLPRLKLPTRSLIGNYRN